jgi:hypothetical protein
LVQALRDFPATLFLATDQHAIRMGKVANGGTFAQKFRIGANHYVKIGREDIS